MNTRQSPGRTISFDSGDEDEDDENYQHEHDKAPSSSEHERRSRSNSHSPPRGERKSGDRSDRRPSLKNQSTSSPSSSRRKHPDSRRKVRPADSSHSLGGASFVSVEDSTHKRRSKTKDKDKDKEKESSKSNTKHAGSSSNQNLNLNSSSDKDKRSKKHDKRSDGGPKRTASSSRRRTAQESLGDSTFASSFANDSLILPVKDKDKTNTSHKGGSERERERERTTKGSNSNSHAATTATGSKTQPHAPSFLPDSHRTGFDIDSPSMPSSRRTKGDESVDSSVLLAGMEGLSEEQKAWAGIARVVEAYGDNGSVATNDVLPQAIARALAESHSTFGMPLPSSTHDFNKNGRQTPVPDSDDSEQSEQDDDHDQDQQRNYAMKNYINKQSAATNRKSGEMPPLMDSSFSSVATETQHAKPDFDTNDANDGNDLKLIVQQISSQEQALKTFIDDVAEILKYKDAITEAPADVVGQYDWEPKETTSAYNDDLDDDDVDDEASQDSRKDSKEKKNSKRNKKDSTTQSDKSSSRRRNSASHHSKKKGNDSRKQRSSRGEDRKGKKNEVTSVSDDEGRKTEGSLDTEPVDLSDLDESARFVASMVEMLSNPPDQRAEPDEDDYDDDIVPRSEPEEDDSTNSYDFDQERQEQLQESGVEAEDDEDFGHLLSPFVSPRPMKHDPDSNLFNNSMPSLVTCQTESDMISAHPEAKQEKWPSYGDLGYVEGLQLDFLSTGRTTDPGFLDLNDPPSKGRNLLNTPEEEEGDEQEEQDSPLPRASKPKKKLKKPKVSEKKIKPKKAARKTKERPAEVSTDTTEPEKNVEDVDTPENFAGFFITESEEHFESPKTKPKTKSLVLPGLAFNFFPHARPKAVVKGRFKENRLAMLRRNVLSFGFWGGKRRRANLIDTGFRDAQFYPDIDDNEESDGALLH